MNTDATATPGTAAPADLPLPASSRRRPTRAAQARQAAQTETVNAVDTPSVKPAETAPVATSTPAVRTSRPARRKEPLAKAEVPAAAPTVQPALPARVESSEIALPPAGKASVQEPQDASPAVPRGPREGRERSGRESNRDNQRERHEPRDGQRERHEPREGREAATRIETPREGHRPDGGRDQVRQDMHRGPQQGFREGGREGGRHRDRDRGRDRGQRGQDMRGGGGGGARAQTSFRDDNRGNRANEREIREMREAKELHDALIAEQGGELEATEVTFDPQAVPQLDITELHDLARGLRIWNYRKMRRSELVHRILQSRPTEAGQARGAGVLEILGEGFGFLRVSEYLPSPDDIYVSQGTIRRHDLWAGDIVSGETRPPRDGEKFQVLVRPDTVNGHPTEMAMRRVPFENRTPIYPCERLRLETTPSNLSMRLMDLFNPLGKGQRALIVSPPKAGKTTLLKQVANSISDNHPEVHLMALLIDERPEEVTDMQRSIKGEVIASTFDELPENHVRVAELVMERAKRMVEMGKDVVILLDSITRLARAYNSAMPPSGRTLSGGLDPNAMHKPKRFFGAARKLERSGSLTIIATALIDTGSRMDEVIYEEFKGTGNSELTLDRRLADRRIFPAIDIKRSSTRKEELLLSPEELRKQRILRKTMDAGDTAEVTEFLADRLSRTKSNAEFLMAISDS